MPKLTIIRGLPGSGKSTIAKKLSWEADTRFMDYYEADMFFMVNGEYKFDKKLLGVAHDWCYSMTVQDLMRGYDTVVPNTFTTKWEMQKYIDIGSLLPDITFEIIEVKTQFESVHGVPPEAIERMKKRWEEVPQEWIDNGVTVKVIK